jgi:hypothetical protein
VAGQVHTFGLSGDAAGFTIDLVSSTVTAASMPPFVAATRELVATESSIVRLSSGTTLSAIAAPPISHGAFAPDFSLLLAVDKSEDPSAARVRVAKVATGATIASIATTSNSYPAAPLAVSRGGRVAAVSGDFYCAR